MLLLLQALNLRTPTIETSLFERMSVQNFKGKCAHCNQLFMGRATKKFCSDECRADFHNRKTSKLRKESLSSSPKSVAYFHNLELLKGLLLSGHRGPYTKSELEDLGYQSLTFFDDKFIQNDDLIWIFGKIQLRQDFSNNTLFIDTYTTKKRFIRPRKYIAQSAKQPSLDDRYNFFESNTK